MASGYFFNSYTSTNGTAAETSAKYTSLAATDPAKSSLIFDTKRRTIWAQGVEYGGATGISEYGHKWTAVIHGATWSRLCYIPYNTNVTGTSFIIQVEATRGSVVYNNTFAVTTHHSSKGSITKISGSNYTHIKVRVLANSGGSAYFELYDDGNSATSSTTQNVRCTLIGLSIGDAPVYYTAFTDGTTLPSGFSVGHELTCTGNSFNARYNVATLSEVSTGTSNLTGGTYTFVNGLDVVNTGETYNINYSYGKFSIPSLSGGSAAESGKYVSGVTVSGHTVTVSKANIPDVGVTGGTAESGKYISQITTNGHGITVTKANLPTIPTITVKSITHSGKDNGAQTGTSITGGTSYKFISGTYVAFANGAYTITYSYGSFGVPKQTLTVTSITDSATTRSAAAGSPTYAYVAGIDMVNSGSSYTLRYSYGTFTIPTPPTPPTYTLTRIKTSGTGIATFSYSGGSEVLYGADIKHSGKDNGGQTGTSVTGGTSYKFISGTYVAFSGGSYTLTYSYASFGVPSAIGISTTVSGTSVANPSAEPAYTFLTGLKITHSGSTYTLSYAYSKFQIPDISEYYKLGRNANYSTTTTWNGLIPINAFGFRHGYPRFTDPQMSTTGNGTFYNAGSGAGTATIVTEATALTNNANYIKSGSPSGNVMEITVTEVVSNKIGGTSKYTVTSKENAVWLLVFRACLPSGAVLQQAMNGTGTGRQYFWVTSNKGTGKWEWYAVIHINGSGGTFSSFGHTYATLTGATAGTKWYISYFQIYELTDGRYDGLRSRFADSADSATNATDADKVDGHHYNSYTLTRALTSGTKIATWQYTEGGTSSTAVDIFAPSVTMSKNATPVNATGKSITGGTAYSYIAGFSVSGHTITYSYAAFAIPTPTPHMSYVVAPQTSSGTLIAKFTYGSYTANIYAPAATSSEMAVGTITHGGTTALAWNTHYNVGATLTSNTTVTLPAASGNADGNKEIVINFTTGATPPTFTITPPSGVTLVWENNNALSLLGNSQYEISISRDKQSGKYTAVWAIFGTAAPGGGGSASGNYVTYTTNSNTVGAVYDIQVVSSPGTTANTLYVVI